jgi:formylglycine-generating enzyme required for sulfatase activity
LDDPALLIQIPDGQGGTFGIDATEVTRAQYAKFYVDKAGDTSGQIGVCAWNASLAPLNEWPPTDELDYPVTWVDWCDAYAYCQWAGKRLCGKIGGGSVPYVDWTNPAVDQWFAACTSGGVYSFPYGDSYDGLACYCDDYVGNVDAWPRSVGGLATCQSPHPNYAGVFDLSGNVSEWEDQCNSENGPNDNCRTRGGQVRDTVASLRCDANSDYKRSGNGGLNIGFRCCSNP